MKPRKNDENAKNPAFDPPVDLPSVHPQDYDASIDSAHGSARKNDGPPDYTLPGYPSGKETAMPGRGKEPRGKQPASNTKK